MRVVDDVCYMRSERAHCSARDSELVNGVPVFQHQNAALAGRKPARIFKPAGSAETSSADIN